MNPLARLARRPAPDPRPATWLEQVTRTTVIVHMKDGGTVTGVLRDVYQDALVLAAPKWLLESGGEESLLGDLGIPRANVAFVQTDPRPVTA